MIPFAGIGLVYIMWVLLMLIFSWKHIYSSSAENTTCAGEPLTWV